MVPLFGYSLPSLCGICGVPARPLCFCFIPLPVHRQLRPGRSRKMRNGFPRLSCTLTPRSSTEKDTWEKKKSQRFFLFWHRTSLPVLPNLGVPEELQMSPTGSPRPTFIWHFVEPFFFLKKRIICQSLKNRVLH